MATPRATSIEKTRRVVGDGGVDVTGVYWLGLKPSFAVTVCTTEKVARAVLERYQPAANGAGAAASGQEAMA
jgi:hypothetical protein